MPKPVGARAPPRVRAQQRLALREALPQVRARRPEWARPLPAREQEQERERGRVQVRERELQLGQRRAQPQELLLPVGRELLL